MKKAWITPKNLAIAIGVILAFIGGRFSASPQDDGNVEAEISQKQSNKPRPTTRNRSKRLTGRVSTPGAGAEAIKTAEQLRDLFKMHGNRGLVKLQAALAKMSSAELAELASNLEEAHATNRGQQNWYEVPQTFMRWAEVDPEAALRFAKSSDTPFHNIALQNVITTIASQDAVYALSEAKRIKNYTLSTQVVQQVISVMASSDPDAWLAEIMSNPKYKLQSSNIGNYVEQWFEKDSSAAIARIKGLPKAFIRQSVFQIASAWAKRDSAAALQWAETLDSPQMKSQAISSIVAVIANEQPERAMKLIDELPNGSRSYALASVYKSMARTNPMAAFEQALSLTNSSDRYTALKSILNPSAYVHGHGHWGSYSHYSGQASPFTLEQLKSITARLPEGNLREAALGQMTRHLMSSSISKTKALLGSYSEAERSKMTSYLIQSLYNADPEKALALHQLSPESSQRNQYYPSLLGSLARINPDKAIKLALAGKTENDRYNYLNSIIGNIVNQDPEKMAHHISSIREEKIRMSAISTTASSWGAIDPDAALNWANRLTNDEKHTAISAIIPSIARHDPIKATRQYETLAAGAGDNTKHKSSLASVASNIASAWSGYDPQAASKWVETITDEKAQISAVSATVNQWLIQDIEKASQWIDTLPEGKTRDTGVIAVATRITNKDPASAFDWAETISQDSQRKYVLSSVIKQWKKHEPERARNAVEQADLTQKEYDYLIKELER